MSLEWTAFDTRGKPIAELPGLRITSSISQIIGRGEAVTVELPAPDRLPPNWLDATQPMRAIMAVAHRTPWGVAALWGGWVEKRTTDYRGRIKLTLQPPEGWLKRNYMPSVRYDGYPGTQIARAVGLDELVQQFNGWVEETRSTRLMVREYDAGNDTDKLTALQRLMQTRHGPEWCTQWTIDGGGELRLIARVAEHLGSTTPVLELSHVAWERLEDCSPGKGATLFTAVGQRQGDIRPQVTGRADRLLAYGWLPLEHRWAPDTGSNKTEILQEYLDEAMATLPGGTSTWSCSVRLDDYPLYHHVRLGDTIQLALTAEDLPELNHTITGRLLGWVADPDPISGEITVYKPILRQVNE